MQSFSQTITTNKQSPNFSQTGCLSCRPTNSIEALKGKLCRAVAVCNDCNVFDDILTADEFSTRVAENAAVVLQHTPQNNSDVANSGLLADNPARPMLDRYWQHQQLLQLRSELPAVDSRIAHLRILMDLARSVRGSLSLSLSL